ncbi:MAG: sensor histidine kinase [Alphaproteobacteria bacterium]|nr:sensor histidine kinase [Alphaproteobacteria bacterium]
MNKNAKQFLTKYFILLYRISVIGIFVAGCLFVKLSLDQEKKKIEEKILGSTEQIERIISYNIDYLKYQFYYATKQIKDAHAYYSDEKIAKILSSFVGGINNQVDLSITWNAFSWIDKQNKMSADGAGGVIKNPVDVSSRDYLKTTSKIPQRLVFGKPVIGALSGRLVIPIAMGVFSDRGDYLGTLVFGLDIERVLDKITQNIGNETLSFAVMNESDTAFASDNFISQNYQKIRELTENHISVGEAQILDRQKNFIGAVNIKDSPLKIFVFYDSNKSHDQLLSIFLKQILFLFLIIFACVILFQVIYYKIIRPVSKLSELAIKISKKDFSFAIEQPKNRELAELFHALNSLKDAVTREDALLKKLATANKSKTEFLAKSSHDIKNYIAAINGLSHLILDKKRNAKLDNEDLQMVTTIADQSQELMHFVEDLLDVNQTDLGDFSVKKFQPHDVTQLLKRVILLNKNLAMERHIQLKSELENDLPKLMCDARRMKQILINLLTNAIKYSKAGSIVVIHAKHIKSEQKICIEISDQGTGMTVEEVEILLSGMGKNINKSHLMEVDSHGVGMPIVLQLVKLHHGKIDIESQKNFGTTVRLYFNC